MLGNGSVLCCSYTLADFHARVSFHAHKIIAFRYYESNIYVLPIQVAHHMKLKTFNAMNLLGKWFASNNKDDDDLFQVLHFTT